MRLSTIVLLLLGVAVATEARRRRGHPPKCSLSPIDARVKKASVVFTGKVTSVVGEEVWVRVKRLLKGHLTDKEVVVSGLGQFPCMRKVRVHDTAVFLTDDELKLSSNLVPLSLRNLDKVNAAAKDVSYKPRPPIIEEPCEKKFCAFGAQCVTDSDGNALCECPENCPSTFTPVCGTDDVTYANECMLRMKSCQQKNTIRVQHHGECGSQGTRRHLG